MKELSTKVKDLSTFVFFGFSTFNPINQQKIVYYEEKLLPSHVPMLVSYIGGLWADKNSAGTSFIRGG